MNIFDSVSDKNYIDIPTAKIDAKVGKNVYKVKDTLGRSYNVYSVTERKKGDVVRVIKGQIVSNKNGKITKTKVVSI